MNTSEAAAMAGCECAGSHFHPLELIPFFRRFRASPLRDALYTLIWSALIGTAFCVIAAGLSGQVPSARAYGIYLAIATLIGYAIHGLFILGERSGVERRAQRSGFLAKTTYFAAIPTVGVILGFQAASMIFHLGFENWLSDPGWVISVASISVVLSLILSAVFYLRERGAVAAAGLERERLRVERIERAATLANLRALQAQIEPHFLFNTLANVASLVDPDPAKAKHMLESFIRFLRASLAATRMETTTLGAEAELIAAYLDVLRVRMGARLAYTIEVPPELASFALPPMLLQPLVENAIRHGLEPKVEGGELAFRARADDANVVIEIRDTGVGFASTTRGGLGLANLRDRLQGLYGERARLEVGENAPAGANVALRLPA
jgi:signal transduction histidine kinase